MNSAKDFKKAAYDLDVGKSMVYFSGDTREGAFPLLARKEEGQGRGHERPRAIGNAAMALAETEDFTLFQRKLRNGDQSMYEYIIVRLR